MTPLRSSLPIVALLATLGQIAPLGAQLVPSVTDHHAVRLTVECICEAGEHNVMCPMHGHASESRSPASAGDDGSCHIRAATHVRLPSLGPTADLPAAAYQCERPVRAGRSPLWATNLRSDPAQVDSPPPRA